MSLFSMLLAVILYGSSFLMIERSVRSTKRWASGKEADREVSHVTTEQDRRLWMVKIEYFYFSGLKDTKDRRGSKQKATNPKRDGSKRGGRRWDTRKKRDVAKTRKVLLLISVNEIFTLPSHSWVCHLKIIFVFKCMLCACNQTFGLFALLCRYFFMTEHRGPCGYVN